MQSILKILLFFLLIVPFESLGQLVWEGRKGIPHYGRHAAVCFEVDGKVFYGLGRSEDGQYLKDFWEYDYNNDSWIRKADFPGAGLYDATGFSIKSKGYVCLGYSSFLVSQRSLYQYDYKTDSWTQKANFPGTARYGANSFVIGDTAYVGMGSCGGTTCYQNDLWAYIASSNSWLQRATWPGGNRNNVAMFSANGKGYAGNGTAPSHAASSAFFEYNPNNNQWVRIADCPGTPKKATTAMTLNGKGYVGCGISPARPPYTRYNTFYSYNPSTNVWILESVNANYTQKAVPEFATVGDSIAISFGGFATYGSLSEVWITPSATDTCTSFDTITIIEPRFIDVYDTTQVFDTTLNVVTDTLLHYDTIQQIIYDTVTVYKLDTTQVFVIDTFYRILFDTTTITVYDTIYNYIDIAVEDTLNFTLYQEGCGNISFQLYPNPTSEFVNFYTDKPDCFPGARVDLVSELGQVISSKPFSPLVSFDMRGLARAIYLIRLVHANGTTVISKKVVVK